jgi:hypothetical protein
MPDLRGLATASSRKDISVIDASGESGKGPAAVETTLRRTPALPDLGNTFLEPDPATGPPGPGESRGEADLLLEEFNTAGPSPAIPAAGGCLPRPAGAYLLALRRHLAAARVDNFVLRERAATLEQELACCRYQLAKAEHRLAAAEWDRNAQQQYNLELKRGHAILERELRASQEYNLELERRHATLEREFREVRASTTWRLANALRGLVRRASGWLRK